MSILNAQQLATRFRDIRMAKGISAQKLSDMTGGLITRNGISNAEHGRREGLSYDEAVAMATALGVDLRTVMTDEPMPIVTKVWVV